MKPKHSESWGQHGTLAYRRLAERLERPPRHSDNFYALLGIGVALLVAFACLALAYLI